MRPNSYLQCNAIHRSIVEQFKAAVVYGKSVKHQPQRVGLAHELADEDVGESCRNPHLLAPLLLSLFKPSCVGIIAQHGHT